MYGANFMISRDSIVKLICGVVKLKVVYNLIRINSFKKLDTVNLWIIHTDSFLPHV